MCGILGGIGKLDKAVIEGLLLANEARGDHSTGIAARSAKGKTTTIKKALPAHQFIYNQDLSIINTSQMVIGHCRWATTGDITDKNAHPLTAGKVTGVHNGVISNHAEIPHGGEVDSQAIFYLLDQHLEKPWEAFKQISGSCTAAWMVEGDNRLHLVKSSNPLALAITDKAIYFSSEYYALFSILRAAGIDASPISEVKEDTWLSIAPDESFSMTVSPVKFKQEPPRKYYKSYSRGVDDEELAEEARERAYLESLQDDQLDLDELEERKAIAEEVANLTPADAAYYLANEVGCAVCQCLIGAGEQVYYDDEDKFVYCEECAKTCGMGDLPLYTV